MSQVSNENGYGAALEMATIMYQFSNSNFIIQMSWVTWKNENNFYDHQSDILLERGMHVEPIKTLRELLFVICCITNKQTQMTK